MPPPGSTRVFPSIRNARADILAPCARRSAPIYQYQRRSIEHARKNKIVWRR